MAEDDVSDIVREGEEYGASEVDVDVDVNTIQPNHTSNESDGERREHSTDAAATAATVVAVATDILSDSGSD